MQGELAGTGCNWLMKMKCDPEGLNECAFCARQHELGMEIMYKPVYYHAQSISGVIYLCGNESGVCLQVIDRHRIASLLRTLVWCR